MDSYSTEFLRNFREKIIKDWMGILILARLTDGSSMSGYDAITFIHRRFHVFLSSSTIYSSLYFLEREDLIEGKWGSRKRVYSLSEKGKKIAKAVLFLDEKIQRLLIDLDGKVS